MLTPDDKHVQSMQLRGNSRITGTGDSAQTDVGARTST